MKNTEMKILFLMLVFFMLDQLLKLLAILFIDNKVIIEGFFKLVYVENTGAAWGILAGNPSFLIITSIIIILLFYFLFIKDKKITTKETFIYGILYGGIIGNLFDRIFRGHVVDFLSFKIFGYNFPVFNFADMCIVLSAIALVIITFRGKKNEKKNSL